MAQYTERLWTQTKDTEQLTFIAGVDLPYRELVKETGPNTNIMVVATTVDAIGYVLSPKGVLAGEKVDIQMLYGGPGGGGGGLVVSVTGLDTDNTDPLNPIVNIAVDGVTITGTGYPGDPLVAVTGGGGTVTSVTGTAPNVLITGTATDPIVNAGTQAWEFSGVIAPPIISVQQDDYNPAGLATATTLHLTGDAFGTPVITGIVGGSQGRILIIHNVTPDSPLYFGNNDVASLAANRFLFVGANPYFILPINGVMILQYDATVGTWRAVASYIYSVTDDGNGVVAVNNGDPANPVVTFNGVFTDGVTITGNGTSFAPLVAPTAPGSNSFNLTYYVDQVYGDDGTAVPDSQVLKYETINAAVTAMGPLDGTIHVSPGSYTITSTIVIGGWKKYYMEPGCTIDCPLNAFSINPGSRLEIKGNGNIVCSGSIFSSSNPTSNAIADVDIECDYFESNAGNQTMFDPTSMKVKIKTNQIFDMGVAPDGWFDLEIATDRWTGQNSSIIRIGDDSLYDFTTKVEANGARKFTLKGRTRQNTEYNRIPTAGGGATYGILISPTTSITKDTVVDLFVNFDCTDGFFCSVGGGITRHYGNLLHRKSDTLGNELPWLYCDQSVVSQDVAPFFEHVYGDYVSATHPVFAGSLNNELVSIRCGGTFVFNGRYKNSGENTGVGAWPCFEFLNADAVNNIQTNLIFNGEIANVIGDVAVFRFMEQGNANHTSKFIFKTVTVECPRTDEVFFSNTTNVPLYIYHSLTMNNNYDSTFYDAMSSNRTIIDREVSVYVPEYPL